MAALDEAMDLADEGALAQLYTVAVDCNVFGPFRSALESHINVGVQCQCGPAHIQARLRRVISDPANDAQMIDQTLTLRRFTNKAVAALFAREEAGEPKAVTREDKQRQLELEDAVRTGFKEGFGSRQNAPAEWIGMPSLLSITCASLTSSKTPRRGHAQGSRFRHRGRVQRPSRRDYRPDRLHARQGRLQGVLLDAAGEAAAAQQVCE